MTVQHRNPTTQKGFTQFPNAILFEARLSPQSRLLYALLKSYAWQTDNSYPGQETIAEALGCTVRMVTEYLQELTACGLVTIERRGFKRTNIYWLEDAVRENWQPTERKKAGRKPAEKDDRKSISNHPNGDDRKSISNQDWKSISNHSGESDRKCISDKEYSVINNTQIEEYEEGRARPEKTKPVLKVVETEPDISPPVLPEPFIEECKAFEKAWRLASRTEKTPQGVRPPSRDWQKLWLDKWGGNWKPLYSAMEIGREADKVNVDYLTGVLRRLYANPQELEGHNDNGSRKPISYQRTVQANYGRSAMAGNGARTGGTGYINAKGRQSRPGNSDVTDYSSWD